MATWDLSVAATSVPTHNKSRERGILGPWSTSCGWPEMILMIQTAPEFSTFYEANGEAGS